MKISIVNCLSVSCVWRYDDRLTLWELTRELNHLRVVRKRFARNSLIQAFCFGAERLSISALCWLEETFWVQNIQRCQKDQERAQLQRSHLWMLQQIKEEARVTLSLVKDGIPPVFFCIRLFPEGCFLMTCSRKLHRRPGLSPPEMKTRQCRPLLGECHVSSQTQLTAMLSQVVVSIRLEWNSPPLLECSRLDNWYLGAGCAAQHRPALVHFFPEVHEEGSKS